MRLPRLGSIKENQTSRKNRDDVYLNAITSVKDRTSRFPAQLSCTKETQRNSSSPLRRQSQFTFPRTPTHKIARPASAENTAPTFLRQLIRTHLTASDERLMLLLLFTDTPRISLPPSPLTRNAPSTLFHELQTHGGSLNFDTPSRANRLRRYRKRKLQWIPGASNRFS